MAGTFQGLNVHTWWVDTVSGGTDRTFFFFSFLATTWHMEFPGQGSDPSCSCDLRCSNARCFNPLCWAAGGQTCILVLQRHCWSCSATEGTPRQNILNITDSFIGQHCSRLSQDISRHVCIMVINIHNELPGCVTCLCMAHKGKRLSRGKNQTQGKIIQKEIHWMISFLRVLRLQSLLFNFLGPSGDQQLKIQVGGGCWVDSCFP